MRARTHRSLHLLIYLLALTPAAYPQTVDQKVKARPGHLYQVSMWDEKSGEKRIGFIDNTGRLVIGFDRLPAGVVVGEFSEGLAAVCYPDVSTNTCRGVGFIDETGSLVIQPRFKHVGKFSEGLAYVDADGLAGFTDRRGDVVVKLKEGGGYEFHEGFAAIRIDGGWGFIDRAGKLLSAERYAHAERFSEGLAAVAVGRGREVNYGFINKEGKMIIPPHFVPYFGHHWAIERLSRFAEGLASVKAGDLYGYIDKKGDFVIPPRFSSPAEFSEGLACVTEGGDAGYIDKSGRWAIAPQFVGCDGFKEGVAAVAVKTARGTKWGYVDARGEMVISPRFDSAFSFVGGVAEVYLEEEAERMPNRSLKSKRAYIDKTGRYIWGPQ